MQTKIICGFPGIGKSHLFKAQPGKFHDSDSSLFSWESPGVRHSNWPKNYINHIRNLDGIVLCSTHQEVRTALQLENIPYVLCYPELKVKQDYINRYIQRGSPQKFIDLLDTSWDNWILQLKQDNQALTHIVLRQNQFLSDVDFENVFPKFDIEKLKKINPKVYEFLKKYAHFSDYEMSILAENTMFNHYCNTMGVINYGQDLLKAIDDIRAAKIQ